MRGLLAILTVVASCNYTVKLDGSKSHALAGKHLVSTKWRSISGKAEIKNPDSLMTDAVVHGNTMFELWGIDNAGLTGRDTMQVNFMK